MYCVTVKSIIILAVGLQAGIYCKPVKELRLNFKEVRLCITERKV